MSDSDKKSGMAFNIPDFSAADMNKMGSQKRSMPDFIDTSGNGQQASLRMFYETGVWWLLGFAVGGLNGIREGWTAAAYPNWKLRLNGVMNGMSKSGGKMSNLLAILAMAHTQIVWGAEFVKVDLYANTKLATPAISGALLGGSYYALSHGVRGPHLMRVGVAMCAGGALSCAYMLGRPVLFDNFLFTNKKAAKY